MPCHPSLIIWNQYIINTFWHFEVQKLINIRKVKKVTNSWITGSSEKRRVPVWRSLSESEKAAKIKTKKIIKNAEIGRIDEEERSISESEEMERIAERKLTEKKG